MSIKEQLAIETLNKIKILAGENLKLIENLSTKQLDQSTKSIDLSFEQLKQDLVDANLKLSKIKAIVTNPNCETFFAIERILAIINAV